MNIVKPTFRRTKMAGQPSWTCTNACFSYDGMACDRHSVATGIGLEAVLKTVLDKVSGMGST